MNDRIYHNHDDAADRPGPPAACVSTDEHGAPTPRPQNKIVAALAGSAGATLVAALVAEYAGIEPDPTTAAVLAGLLASIVGTASGYFRTNDRSSR